MGRGGERTPAVASRQGRRLEARRRLAERLAREGGLALGGTARPLGFARAAIPTVAAELPGGVRRIVHVAAAELKVRMDGGGRPALCGVRDAAEPAAVLYCRHVELLGPSSLWDQDDADALPGTAGRGVCYLVTDAPLRVHFDAAGDAGAEALLARAGASAVGLAARTACEAAGLLGRPRRKQP